LPTNRKLRVAAPAAAALLLAALAAGCGYHVAGRAASLPAGWKTIAVPAFVNRTHRYRIEQRLTEAVIRELLARTSYRIVQNENAADAVLRGEVTGIDANAVLFDTQTGRATTMLVTIHVQARLIDRKTAQVIYQNPNFVFRDEYEISSDPKSFFEEEDPALDRMARDFAASLVSAILEKF
jgi:outer membrane lipopolysaccharide assembly protein LptE/RlpB